MSARIHGYGVEDRPYKSAVITSLAAARGICAHRGAAEDQQSKSTTARIDDLQNYCLGTRRGIAADRGRPAVGFVYISNGKLVHFIFSLWPFSS